MAWKLRMTPSSMCGRGDCDETCDGDGHIKDTIKKHAVVAAFKQDKTLLVGAFSVIAKTSPMVRLQL